MKKIRTHYNYVVPKGEVNDGEQLVETIGYRTTQQQVQSYLRAGVRLQQAREGLYQSDYEQFDSEENYYSYYTDILEAKEQMSKVAQRKREYVNELSKQSVKNVENNSKKTGDSQESAVNISDSLESPTAGA